MKYLGLLSLFLILSAATPEGCNSNAEGEETTSTQNTEANPDPATAPAEVVTEEEITEDIEWTEMAIDPVQCNSNPWEEEYLATNPDDYSGLKNKELDVIKEFYEAQGVKVKSVRSEQTHDYVCEACTCPRGDTVYLIAAKNDQGKLAQMGFRVPGSRPPSQVEEE